MRSSQSEKGQKKRKEIRMPIVDIEIESYVLMKWLIETGELVEIDQDLAELDNGEEQLCLPSPLDGVILELCCVPGETVSPGDVLAIIEET